MGLPAPSPTPLHAYAGMGLPPTDSALKVTRCWYLTPLRRASGHAVAHVACATARVAGGNLGIHGSTKANTGRDDEQGAYADEGRSAQRRSTWQAGQRQPGRGHREGADGPTYTLMQDDMPCSVPSSTYSR